MGDAKVGKWPTAGIPARRCHRRGVKKADRRRSGPRRAARVAFALRRRPQPRPPPGLEAKPTGQLPRYPFRSPRRRRPPWHRGAGLGGEERV